MSHKKLLLFTIAVRICCFGQTGLGEQAVILPGEHGSPAQVQNGTSARRMAPPVSTRVVEWKVIEMKPEFLEFWEDPKTIEKLLKDIEKDDLEGHRAAEDLFLFIPNNKVTPSVKKAIYDVLSRELPKLSTEGVLPVRLAFLAECVLGDHPASLDNNPQSASAKRAAEALRKLKIESLPGRIKYFSQGKITKNRVVEFEYGVRKPASKHAPVRVMSWKEPIPVGTRGSADNSPSTLEDRIRAALLPNIEPQRVCRFGCRRAHVDPNAEPPPNIAPQIAPQQQGQALLEPSAGLIPQQSPPFDPRTMFPAAKPPQWDVR